MGFTPLPTPLPSDPEQAKRLLDKAGWHENHGQRYRRGKPFRFTALVWNRYGLKPAAIYVQSQLRRVGVQMDIANLEPDTVRARVMAGDFEAALTLITEAGPPGPLRFFGRNGYIGYDNSQVTTLLEQTQNTVSPEELDRIYRELQAPFQADMPATFLYPAVHTTVAHKRVRGLSSPYRVDPLLGNTEFLSLDNSGNPRAEPRGAIRLSGGLNSPERELVYGVRSNFEWAGEDRPGV